jgi:hypothetical protein
MGGDGVDRRQDGLHRVDANEWVKKSDIDSGRKAGVTSDERAPSLYGVTTWPEPVDCIHRPKRRAGLGWHFNGGVTGIG